MGRLSWLSLEKQMSLPCSVPLLFVVFFLTAASTEKDRKQFVSRAGDVIAHASHPTTPHASPSRGHDESCVHEGNCIRG